MVAKGELLAAFNRHLAEGGKPSMTKMAFGLAVKRARPEISEGQRTIQGRVQWVYTGIGLEAGANG
jgi:hypothetical protein